LNTTPHPSADDLFPGVPTLLIRRLIALGAFLLSAPGMLALLLIFLALLHETMQTKNVGALGYIDLALVSMPEAIDAMVKQYGRYLGSATLGLSVGVFFWHWRFPGPLRRLIGRATRTMSPSVTKGAP
jgi:hypothetical protein